MDLVARKIDILDFEGSGRTDRSQACVQDSDASFGITSWHRLITYQGYRQTVILIWNLWWLNQGKIDSIAAYFNTFDVVCLTETWVESKNRENMKHLPEKLEN